MEQQHQPDQLPPEQQLEQQQQQQAEEEDPIVAQEKAYREEMIKTLFTVPKKTYVPDDLAKVIPPTEQYITSLRLSSNGKCDVLALTSTKVYKLSSQLKKKWGNNVRDVYRVKVTDGKTLHIDFLKKVGNDGM